MPVASSVYAGDPVTARGSATAPGAGGTIATLTLPGPGRYEVEVLCSFGATGDVADNVQLVVTQGTPSVSKTYSLGMTAGANSNAVRNMIGTITVFGFGAGATLTVQAIAAGGAGSIYSAEIIARPLVV